MAEVITWLQPSNYYLHNCSRKFYFVLIVELLTSTREGRCIFVSKKKPTKENFHIIQTFFSMWECTKEIAHKYSISEVLLAFLWTFTSFCLLMTFGWKSQSAYPFVFAPLLALSSCCAFFSCFCLIRFSAFSSFFVSTVNNWNRIFMY